jgi:hypothetical protein
MNDNDAITRNLLQALLAGADCLTGEIEALVRQWMEQDVTRDMAHAGVYYRLGDELLSHEALVPMCRYLPQLLADVTRYELLITNEELEPYRSHDLLDLGIRSGPDRFPPSPFKGPFLGLLRSAPRIGADLVLDLTNHATQAWIRRKRSSWHDSEGDKPLPQRLVLDGQVCEIWGDAKVWRWFRYPSFAPIAITSVLMALEHWLSDLLHEGVDTKYLFDFFLRRTTSAAVVGVLSSVAVKYPEKCAQAVLPVLRCPGFWTMDRERLLHDQTEAILVNSEESEWVWISRAAREEHRRGDLESLAFRLMLTDMNYRAELFPTIRTFPDTLPYTDERQMGDELAEMDLRQTCEFMVLRTDVENLRPVELGDGIFGFEPKVMPEHLARVQEETQRTEAQQNELLGLKLWALKHLDDEPPGDRYTPETALATAQHIAAEASDRAQDLFFVRELKEVVALVAAALVCCHGDWLCDEDAVQWCRRQLLFAALDEEMESPAYDAYAHYPWGTQRSAARALPRLLAWFSQDEELRFAVAALSLHRIEEVRFFTYGALKCLWETMPAFVWRCICLGVEHALRRHDRIEGEGDEALLSRLASQLERAASDATAGELVGLSGKTSTVIDWKRLESVVQALPDSHASLAREWQEKLLALYEDWLRFTIAVHIDVEDAGMGRRVHLYWPDDWDHLFLQALGRLIVVLPLNEATRRFVDPILEAWEQTPRLMEAFLHQLLKEITALGTPRKDFTSLWKGIGEKVLSSETIRAHQFHHDHSIENILAILVFADPYLFWHVDRWDPVAACVDLIDQWCAVVGHVSTSFRALISLLSTIGFPLFVERGVTWLSLCLANAGSVDLLHEGSNAVALAKLLMKAYHEQREALVAADATWRAYNGLVDRLARIGEPRAVDLQQRIRSFQGGRPKRATEGWK